MRAIAVDEWRRWRALRLAALAEAPEAFDSTYDDWARAEEARWHARLAGARWNLVAELDGDAAGMASVVAADEPDVFELVSMWVAPFARGRGVGDALVRAACERSRGGGARALELDVGIANARAAALYARGGFALVGESDGSTRQKPQHRMRASFGPSEHI